MLKFFELGFLSLFLIFACARPSPKSDDPSLASTGSESKLPKLDPEVKDAISHAETFDRFVNGKLSPEETTALTQSCQTAPEKNIFCYAVQHADQIERRSRIRKAPPRHPEPKIIEPLPPKFSGNKLTNWKELRNGNIKRLLKGVEGFSLAQLRQLAKRASKDRHCPNQIAIAVSATMEEYLPDQVGLDEIASLYERGATCARRSPGDRENYLTRAGLLYFLKKDYTKAASLFNRSIAAGSSFSGRALYWLARCKDARNDKAGARATIEQLTSRYPFSFHSLVANVSHDRDPGEPLLKVQPFVMKRSQKVAQINPLIAEAEELKRFNFDSSAALIVDWAFELAGRAEPEIRLYLASMGDDRTKVVMVGDIITRHPNLISRQTLEMYFPKAFFPMFEKSAQELNPFILMSVARQESVFNPKAISPANAQGLLQMHPDTSAKLLPGQTVDLLDPDTNIAIGARYLTELVGQMNGKIYLALAAYNAGVEKLAVWTHRYPQEDPILFIDLISYKETRTYVAAVLRNFYWYRRIFSQSDKEALRQVIEPQVTKNGTVPAAAPVAVPVAPAPATPEIASPKTTETPG